MKRVFAAILLTVISSAPAWSQKKIDQIVARVNGDIILRSDLDRELADRREQYRDQGLEGARLEQRLAEDSKSVLRDLIDTALLVQTAKEYGISVELDVFKAMEELRVERGFATAEALEKAITESYGDVDDFKNKIREDIYRKQVIEHEVYGRIVITTEEKRTYYEAHKQEFDKPAGIRVAGIVVIFDNRLPDQKATQRKKIDEAYAALKKGDPFEDVSRKFSEVAGAEEGGDMGFFGPDELNEDRQKILSLLGKGQITEIQEETNAFTIYKVTDKHTGGILSFELAEPYIWQTLMSEQAPPKVREYLMKKREEGFVEVKEGYEDAAITAKAAAAPKP